MSYPGDPTRVRFLSRPNKYLAIVRPMAGGPRFEAHVPNPGRMGELLLPGETVGYTVPAPGIGRRTAADLVSVEHRGTVVSIDSRVANRLVGKALASGALSGFGPGPWRAEVRVGSHRLDFGRAGGAGSPTDLLEVKSSNLASGTTAMFPDAPTLRGTAHLELLRRFSRRGVRCGLVIMVQRTDVDRFRPNSELDPAFGRAFDRAAAGGVRIEAWTMVVEPARVAWGRQIPVEFGRSTNVFRRRPPIAGR